MMLLLVPVFSTVPFIAKLVIKLILTMKLLLFAILVNRLTFCTNSQSENVSKVLALQAVLHANYNLAENTTVGGAILLTYIVIIALSNASCLLF